jgi:hypothetical protein
VRVGGCDSAASHRGGVARHRKARFWAGKGTGDSGVFWGVPDLRSQTPVSTRNRLKAGCNRLSNCSCPMVMHNLRTGTLIHLPVHRETSLYGHLIPKARLRNLCSLRLNPPRSVAARRRLSATRLSDRVGRPRRLSPLGRTAPSPAVSCHGRVCLRRPRLRRPGHQGWQCRHATRPHCTEQQEYACRAPASLS